MKTWPDPKRMARQAKIKQGLNILIIEDIPSLRDTYRDILPKWGHRPVFSLSLPEIVQALPLVDFVISDYNMGLDFDEIARLVRHFKKPMLAITACGEKVYPNQIDKPFGARQLVDEIARIYLDY